MNPSTPFLFLAFAATALVAAPEATPPTPLPPQPSMAECVNTLDLARATRTNNGFQFWFAGRDLADGKTLKMSIVAPRSGIHAPHRHDEDEFYFVLEGTAEVTLNGETATIGPNSSFYCPRWSEHGIRNVGDTELRYLVIKQYNPENPAAAPTRS